MKVPASDCAGDGRGPHRGGSARRTTGRRRRGVLCPARQVRQAPADDGRRARRAAASFLDKDAKTRSAPSVRPVGLPAIDWTDQAEVRLSLSLDAFGPPSLTMSDQLGRVRMAGSVNPSGSAELRLQDPEGPTRLVLGIKADGRPGSS